MRKLNINQIRIAGAALVVLLSVATAGYAEDEFDCLVVPSQTADLSFAVSGLLSTLSVERGGKVKQGDILATLDATVETSNLEIAKARAASTAARESAEAQLDLSNKQYERNKRLFNSRNLPQAKLEESGTALQGAKLRVQEARENQVLFDLDVARAEAFLKLKSIVSPFSGVVVERHLSPGAYVENKPVLTIAKIDPVSFDAVLPADLHAQLKVQQDVDVVLEQASAGKVTATVRLIDPYVDAASGTFRMRLEAPNSDGRIVPGYRCKVSLADPPSGLSK